MSRTRGAGDDAAAPPGAAALFTDLYQLTMLQAYWREGIEEEAVFSLFVRSLPHERAYLVACGLDDALALLETLRFDPPALEYLASLGGFSDAFLAWLEGWRFRGDVYGVAEGTPIFPHEPLLEVVAPIAEGQLVETALLNRVHLQTVLASKAVRVVAAAAGRPVVDFGMRRAHGRDAALAAARAAWIAGATATSNVLAGRLYGIPVTGTMAHSYIEAHDDELGAFRAFAALYPETTLLVDTYDTVEGVRRVVALARELGPDFRVRAIRLDSGDLGALARAARRVLDEAGLERVQILASGGLDEYRIAALVADGAPIDAWAVGSRLAVSSDVPDLDMVYKLVAHAGRGRLKRSTGKEIWPGPKQVFRVEEDGRAVRDVIARHDETGPGRPLLEPVMRGGERLPAGRVPLDRIRARAAAERARLPERLHGLAPPDPPYPVEISAALRALRDETLRAVSGGAPAPSDPRSAAGSRGSGRSPSA